MAYGTMDANEWTVGNSDAEDAIVDCEFYLWDGSSWKPYAIVDGADEQMKAKVVHFTE